MKPSNPGTNFSISNLQKFTLNDTQVWFIRISIDNLQETVAEIMQIIADVSWIEGLTSISKESFMARARPTIDVLIEELTNYLGSCDEEMIKTIGEAVVSVIARSAIERILQYKALPIAELIKQKVRGNPGFDFHHEKDELMIVFGEAKYVSNSNAYNKSLSQIVKFIADRKHLKDIPDIDRFLSQSVLNNVNNCQSDRDPISRCIENKGSVLVYTTKASIYNGAVFDDLDDYISELCNVDNDAVEIIKNIEELIGGSSNKDNEHYSDLLALLYKGVVIHHGSLPLNVRYLVEEFVRNGHCRICFATSTLYQGINMPFDIVYIKRFKNNPLFIKNLVGRAGRSTKKPEFDFGRVIVNKSAMSDLRNIYDIGVKISSSSNIDTDDESDETDIKEFKDAIRNGQFNDSYGLTYQQVERLNRVDNDVHIENIINNILDNNGNFDTEKYKDLMKRDIVIDSFSRLYAVYLKGRQPTDAEINVIRTAVEVFLQQISGHSLRHIVGSRFAYIAKTNERKILKRSLPDSVYRLKCNAIYPAYSTPAPKSGLPNKDLKEYPLFSMDKYKAHEVSYDLVMYDTYDYIDKIWGFCLSDIFYAVFNLFYERTQDARADKMRKLIRYATVDEKEIFLLRYGFLFEDIEWIKPLVVGIDEKRIKFGDISNLSEKQKSVISRYIPDE